MKRPLFGVLLSAFLALVDVQAFQAQEPAASSAEERIKTLESRLDKLEHAPASASLSSFNPAMGLALDFAYSHADDKAGVNTRILSVGSNRDQTIFRE